MRIGVLGTGMVGQVLAAKLAEAGHEVVVGTRDPAATLARQEPDGYGNPPFSAWHAQHPDVKVGSFADAATHGELVVNATAGAASLDALRLAGEANLHGSAARATEMVLPVWLRLMGTLRTPAFNFKVVR
jgi:predicted dinucleotide-binding enzyme